jgi:TadE-like protein
MSTRFLRRRADGRGQALVEFALIIPLFILIVIGIFEGGRAIYTYNALSNGVREALREAIVHQDQTAIEAEANRVLGGLSGGTQFTHDLSGCPDPTDPNDVCIYRVELRYQFNPILIGAIFSPVISADGEMQVESTNP